MDFNGLLKTYVEEVLNKGIKRSARTDLSKIHKYLLPRLGDKKIADMTEADIVAYLHDLDLKPATRNRHLALIKAVFTWLSAWDISAALRRFISKRCLK